MTDLQPISVGPSAPDGDGPLVINLVGELDLVTAHTITRFLEDRIADGHRAIAIDLAQVTFADASGLGPFVIIRQLLERVEGTLILQNPQPRVRKVLELSGLAMLLSR